jgi:hypothetical protein
VVHCSDYFLKNYSNSPKFWATFSTVKVIYVLIFAKMGWATFWARFFTNSSGHPVYKDLVKISEPYPNISQKFYIKLTDDLS